MDNRREENTADSPPHADPKGVNPPATGPAQPRDVDRPERVPEKPAPGQPGDRTKDAEGGGI
jgi:hypothetical protein